MSTIANVKYLDPTLVPDDACSQVDVVDEHHRRNRFPRAPDPQRLREVDQSVVPDRPSAPVERDEIQDNFSFTQSNTDGLDAPQQILPPPGELTGAATKLRSYPYKFREIIERAKQFAQCGSATDPFPNRTWFVNKKSAEYITEAIAEREAKDVYIPPGGSCITLIR